MCRPPLRCFGKYWTRIFGERMERREAVCEGKKYQATNICGKGEWNGRIEGTSGVGDELTENRRDDEKEGDTWKFAPWLKVSKDQMGHLT